MKVASNGGSEKEPDKNKIKQTNSLTAQGNDDTIYKLRTGAAVIEKRIVP